jgi:hypothetical protein
MRVLRLAGYTRRSATVVTIIAAVGTVAGLIWRRYLEFGDPDPLLMVCW